MPRNKASRFQSKQHLLNYLSTNAPLTLQFGGILPDIFERKKDREFCSSRTWDSSAAFAHFVIDVDLDAYDKFKLREGICACQERDMCDVCWKIFMEPARQVLEYLICTVMQFKSRFYVYSGRRGFHLWVLDKRVVMWTRGQRTTIIQWLKKAYKDPQHQEVLYNMLLSRFEKYFAPKTREWFLWETQMLPHELRRAKRRMVFKTLYPKLDVEVSKDPLHLIKLPFVPHPSTLNLTMPIPVPGSKHVFVPSKHATSIENINIQVLRSLAKIIEAALDIAYGKEWAPN